MKRCPRNSAPTSTAASLRTPQLQHQTRGFLGGIFRSATSPVGDWFQGHHVGGIVARGGPLAQGRPASKMMPPTQQGPLESQMSGAALRARQSPSLSLFNQLDGLVLQLEASRNFFDQWPQLVCQRIRRGASGQRQESSQPRLQNASSSSGECWNGRDFSG